MKDFIDSGLWKKIQEDFSDATGLNLALVDSEGKVLVKSGKNKFLCELINSRDSSICKRYFKEGLEKGSLINKCGCGLHFIAVPVNLNGVRKAGIILCGIRKDTDFDFSFLADRLNLSEEELRDSFDRISIEEDIEHYIKLSRFLATLPKLIYEKSIDRFKINRLEFLHKVSQVVNSSLELDEILDFVMNMLIDNIGLGSCSIVTLGNERRRYCLKKHFIANNDIERAVVSRIIKEKDIVSIDDIRGRFKMDFVARSIVSIPLKAKENIVGVVNMYNCRLDNKDLEFVSIISDQVSLAILNAQQYKEIKDIAVRDKLTGVYNRRYFMELFDRRLGNFKDAVSLILIDIDNFGSYNNDYGHLKGDELLKGIGDILIENVKTGIIGRYGGEEFIILLEKKYNKANEIAEKIRKDIELCNKFERNVTVSIGLVSCLDAKMTKEEIIKEADNNLYRAKSKGKNQIVKSAVVRKNLKTDI